MNSPNFKTKVGKTGMVKTPDCMPEVLGLNTGTQHNFNLKYNICFYLKKMTAISFAKQHSLKFLPLVSEGWQMVIVPVCLSAHTWGGGG